MSEAHSDGEPTTATHAPRPNTVRYNDWRQVEVPAVDAFKPTLGVSVVVPYFEAPDKLALTLAGLEGQSYPRQLFEVVIVDDGSQPPLEQPTSQLNLKVVHQEKRGFGLTRARNNGARAACHDILVFLDGDMIPEAGWLEAHARWHHVVADALTLGFYARVSVEGVDPDTIRHRPASLKELFSDRESDPPWTERQVVRTDNFTSKHDDLFRAVSGGNLGIGKAYFDALGGFEESFDRHGSEDTEFGYRGQTCGGLLVPTPDAFAWHQGRWIEDRAAKRKNATTQGAKLSNLIAHPDYRRESPGRSFAVPRYVVTIQADQGAAQVLDLAEQVLADPLHDLVVRIEMPDEADDDDRAWLEDTLEPDPRVRVAPKLCALEEFPASPFHVDLPAGTTYQPGLLDYLHGALGTAVQASHTLADGCSVSITRTWARHRARRTGQQAEDFGDTRTLEEPPSRARMRRSRSSARPEPASADQGSSPLARVVAEARRIRDIRSAGRFLKWLSQGVRWWVVRGRKVRAQGRRDRRAQQPIKHGDLSGPMSRVLAEARNVRGLRTGRSFAGWLIRKSRWWIANPKARRQASSPAPLHPGASYSLGAEIVALGERAQAVFAASSRVAHRVEDGRHVDIVLADTPSAAPAGGAPTVILSELPHLAVPAFDPRVHNPIGWVRSVENRVAALGPRDLLPPGVKANRSLDAADQEVLRRIHHLEDVQAFHPDPVVRAGVLVRLAAMGVPVHIADQAPGLAALLGAELFDLMTADVSYAENPNARELFSIRLRRIALREHSLGSRARQVCETVLEDPTQPPAVSVLLATMRPECLSWAVSNVVKQTYPRLELVLALHGPAFEKVDVDRIVADCPTTILRLSEKHSLGSVLNAAVSASTGTLVTKMDDDDLYGADHVWDLVLAREYSGAELVGKGAEIAYASGPDRTILRRRDQSETYTRGIAGGALLISRSDLQRAGAWRRVRSGVDNALIDDVLGAGGSVYRTHGAGMVLMRNRRAHTWNAEDHRLLANADEVYDGWRPDLAGMDSVPKPGYIDTA